jgi:hypothetical protein
MSKLVKLLAGLVLAVGLMTATPDAAQARRWHGGWHAGWHVGWYGWHGGWGRWGWRARRGWRYPYVYYPRVFYAPAHRCGWVRYHVVRHHHRVLRRAWRCW